MATIARQRFVVVAASLATLATGGISYAAIAPSAHDASPSAGATKTPGPKGDRAVTPIGYGVTPAGTQTTVGHLPLNAALNPNGKTLLLTNNGQATQSVQLVDVASGKITQTIEYKSPESVYVGLAWSPDGKTAYASAAANSKIRVYSFDGTKLTEKKPLALPTKAPGGTSVQLFPAGLAVTKDGRKLVVADQLGNAVTWIDVASG